MTRKLVSGLFTLILVASVSIPVLATADAGNPCGGKANNPCGLKAQNPCGGKAMNPCGGKAMNPCGSKTAQVGVPAINPCFAKMGTVFHVNDPMQRNQVTFRSEAPLEDIVGTTNQILGYVVFDPKRPEKGGRAELVVPVTSLRTGIPLRDEHLIGSQWLDGAKHEAVSYRIDELEDINRVKRGDGFTTWEVTTKGSFTLHGVTRKLETKGTLTWLEQSDRTKSRMDGNLLAIRSTFEVPLEDFGIEGFDGVVGSKVGESIEVEVSLVGTDVAPKAAAANPCAKKKGNAAASRTGD